MNSFLLPFLLTIALAIPLLWYHLDGTDPLDIAVRPPSQAEFNFAETQDLLGDPGSGFYPAAGHKVPDSDDALVTIGAGDPGR